MCEMCKRETVLIGFGLCELCSNLEDEIVTLMYTKYTHVSEKNVYRYLLTKDHEVNARGDHPSDDDTCVNMHADCTHE
jgi:hypothetical protein